MVGDHMQYVIGALIMALLFAAFVAGYYLGGKSRTPLKPKEVDEQEAHKAKELRKGFEQLMSYDVAKAVSGKKVT